MSVEKAKFRNPVLPDCELHLEIEAIRSHGRVWKYKGTAKVEGKSFEGNEGKNIQLVLGKDLFIKGFDSQLVGIKKNQNKSVTVKLPENYPNKELANKKADFNCKVINIKKPIDVK